MRGLPRAAHGVGALSGEGGREGALPHLPRRPHGGPRQHARARARTGGALPHVPWRARRHLARTPEDGRRGAVRILSRRRGEARAGAERARSGPRGPLHGVSRPASGQAARAPQGGHAGALRALPRPDEAGHRRRPRRTPGHGRALHRLPRPARNRKEGARLPERAPALRPGQVRLLPQSGLQYAEGGRGGALRDLSRRPRRRRHAGRAARRGHSGSACLSCHSPHAGRTATLLRRDSPAAMCFACHDRSKFEGKVRHKVVDDCTTCHAPHGSANEGLLLEPQAELCASCHDAEKTHAHVTGAPAIDPRTGKTLRCTSCHSPHASDHESLLRQEKERKLCIQCHVGPDLDVPTRGPR